jgi:hypothetical protein
MSQKNVFTKTMWKKLRNVLPGKAELYDTLA